MYTVTPTGLAESFCFTTTLTMASLRLGHYEMVLVPVGSAY
jgi:hypothetical protein